ncbi:MAG: sigma 54-interacting transcriptional regulator [Sinimarinibacterium flocculans]|uniref:sigma 54-interacting transcriptional regulator n=1 Tax=Sinimarinibacterium flocculans TaxID=985250 RepID=UPI003C68F404
MPATATPTDVAAVPQTLHPSVTVDSLRYPDIADLISRLHFSPEDGHIWLHDQRMLLLHASALGVLRRELIESLGLDSARGLLTRMGYNSGAHDAELARRVRPHAKLTDMFMVGPQLHMLEGMVAVEPVRLEMDVERGKYYGEFIWTNSFEDEEHVRIYGIGAEAACWMLVGYASGYTSVFMGRPVLYREVECRAQGDNRCRIIGKPADDWGDEANEDYRFFQAQAFTQGVFGDGSNRTNDARDVRSATPFKDDHVVGVSAGFNAVCHMVKRVAPTQATVLFLGESGVGKEVFAQTLHRISSRANGPFVAVNCAAIPESLIEAELFGVERGAYTGANQTRPGRFERADGGTLFLDEIGILSSTAQGKLLRALQEGEIERVGGTQSRHVDVRVVAATNLDLREESRAGRFREDLFYRLNVFPVTIPPLRERREDIPVLMNHFMHKFSARHGRQVTGFTERAISAMLSYSWPGNIREMQNMIERAVILAPEDGAIDIGHIFSNADKPKTSVFGLGDGGTLASYDSLERQHGDGDDPSTERVFRKVSSLLGGNCDDSDPTSLDEIETALLKSAVNRAGGNLSAAARMLGITRPQLAYRLKSRGLRDS